MNELSGSILAVEGAAPQLKLFLRSHNGQIHTLIPEGHYHHSELLISSVEKLLNISDTTVDDLCLLVCGAGPGSFTGLRIAMSTMKGMALGRRLPLVSLPTLDIQAAPHGEHENLLALLDARKQSYYAAFYANGERRSDYLDIGPRDLLSLCRKHENEELLLCGEDAHTFYESLPPEDQRYMRLSAKKPIGESMIQLAIEEYHRRGADPPGLGPFYLRRSDAEEKKVAPELGENP